jgi:hypothetical protein
VFLSFFFFFEDAFDTLIKDMKLPPDQRLDTFTTTLGLRATSWASSEALCSKYFRSPGPIGCPLLSIGEGPLGVVQCGYLWTCGLGKRLVRCPLEPGPDSVNLSPPRP